MFGGNFIRPAANATSSGGIGSPQQQFQQKSFSGGLARDFAPFPCVRPEPFVLVTPVEQQRSFEPFPVRNDCQPPMNPQRPFDRSPVKIRPEILGGGVGQMASPSRRFFQPPAIRPDIAVGSYQTEFTRPQWRSPNSTRGKRVNNNNPKRQMMELSLPKTSENSRQSTAAVSTDLEKEMRAKVTPRPTFKLAIPSTNKQQLENDKTHSEAEILPDLKADTDEIVFEREIKWKPSASDLSAKRQKLKGNSESPTEVVMIDLDPLATPTVPAEEAKPQEIPLLGDMLPNCSLEISKVVDSISCTIQPTTSATSSSSIGTSSRTVPTAPSRSTPLVAVRRTLLGAPPLPAAAPTAPKVMPSPKPNESGPKKSDRFDFVDRPVEKPTFSTSLSQQCWSQKVRKQIAIAAAQRNDTSERPLSSKPLPPQLMQINCRPVYQTDTRGKSADTTPFCNPFHNESLSNPRTADPEKLGGCRSACNTAISHPFQRLPDPPQPPFPTPGQIAARRRTALLGAHPGDPTFLSRREEEKSGQNASLVNPAWPNRSELERNAQITQEIHQFLGNCGGNQPSKPSGSCATESSNDAKIRAILNLPEIQSLMATASPQMSTTELLATILPVIMDLLQSRSKSPQHTVGWANVDERRSSPVGFNQTDFKPQPIPASGAYSQPNRVNFNDSSRHVVSPHTTAKNIFDSLSMRHRGENLSQSRINSFPVDRGLNFRSEPSQPLPLELQYRQFINKVKTGDTREYQQPNGAVQFSPTPQRQVASQPRVPLMPQPVTTAPPQSPVGDVKKIKLILETFMGDHNSVLHQQRNSDKHRRVLELLPLLDHLVVLESLGQDQLETGLEVIQPILEFVQELIEESERSRTV